MPEPILYTDLAPWWPLLSPPEEYEEEAAFVRSALEGALGGPPGTLLELGAGGGSLACHLRSWSRLTLSDLSPAMLDVSRIVNPGCEHVQGDMRALRLHRRFDAVLVHDAIAYMTTPDDLDAVLQTVAAHLVPGGAALVIPDHVAETYEPGTSCGGHDAADGSGRGLRYLEWDHPRAEGASTTETDYVLVLREVDGSTRVVHDRHVNGLFAREAWREAFRRVGLSALEVVEDPWGRSVFVARAG